MTSCTHIAPRPRPGPAKNGPIFCTKTNLFSSPSNGAISIVILALLLWVILQVFEWAVLNSVWNAGSFEECREIIAAIHGDGANGACWAVFNGRIAEFLVGPYPQGLAWRPAAAFALILLALIPLLFTGLPRWLLWFSAGLPAAAYILFIGGFGFEAVRSVDIGGLLLVLIIAAISTVIAILSGILLAIIRTHAIAPVRVGCAAIIAIFRGVPVLVLSIVSVTLWAYFMPPGTYLDFVVRAGIVIAMPTSAIIAMNVHKSLASFPAGQRQAAYALGLSRIKTFQVIVLPQVLKGAAPMIVHAVSSLFRNTVVVSAFAFLDPLRLTNMIRLTADWNGVIWEFFVLMVLLYGAVSLAISGYARCLENKLRSEGRPVESPIRIEE